ACCCQIGAHYAGAEASSVERLAAYGQKLGVAFQIADDLLDLVGDEGKVGKSLGTDLVKQKLTLPMIRLLGSASSEHRQTVIEQLGRSDNHRRELLRPWLERYDTFAYARGKAEAFIAGAVDELSCLPESPARESLAAIARFTLERQQ
ncbi:MAG: polyprenyl synthetase family protein, partial [Planctomycetota bacterium]